MASKVDDGNWIHLYRELLDKPVWQDSTPEQKTILITLLLMVKFSPERRKFGTEMITVQPGQVVTGLQKIADKCGKGVTIRNVRTALKNFKMYEFLTYKTTNKGMLVTIENWALYQGDDKQTDKQTDTLLTQDRHATDMQVTSNRHATDNYKELKKEKNDEEGKNDKNNSSSKQSSDKPLKFANDPESMPFRLTAYLIKHMKRNDPKCKAPNEGTKQFDDWCVHMDRLMRLDGRSSEEVKKVIEWTQNDSFEQTVVLSASKLRDRFPQLLLKATKPTSASKKNDFHNFKGAASKYSPDELEAKYLAKHGRKK